MREEVTFYRWICDDCGQELITPTSHYPDGWDEVDDNSKGECQDICNKCLVNHEVID